MENYVTCCNDVHSVNDIGFKECESLSNGLIHNKGLRVLDLRGERITYEQLCNILL